MHATIEQSAAPPTRLFSPADLAELFKVGKATILDWARDGKLPKPVGPGRSPRWTQKQIAAFLESQGG
jgi:predicted DNA-binding transcriptional regulator AlpA